MKAGEQRSPVSERNERAPHRGDVLAVGENSVPYGFVQILQFVCSHKGIADAGCRGRHPLRVCANKVRSRETGRRVRRGRATC